MNLGLRHQALFYATEREFYDATVPFIAEGVATGEPVMVAVSDVKIARLRRELGEAADAVEFVEMSSIGRNPARIIPAWREFLGANGDGPARGIGEPAWPGRTDAELCECDRHESLLNVAFDDVDHGPFTLLCPYDVSALDDEVAAAARRNHPELISGGHDLENHEFRPPGNGSRDPFAGELPEPPHVAERLEFNRGALPSVRRFAWSHAHRAGLAPPAQADLVLSISELANNSVMHGGGGGTVTAWDEPRALVFEVGDSGHFDDPLAGRRRPGPLDSAGRGLWIVNQFCDLVQIRSGPEGSRVRVRVAA